jgi:hypothetical protein
MQMLVDLCLTQVHTVTEKFFFTAAEVYVKEWEVTYLFLPCCELNVWMNSVWLV